MSKHRSGFTLVELLVVIGLIVFLIGLTLTAGTVVIEQSERRETQNTLRLLDGAVSAWELAADRTLTWWHYTDAMNLKDQADVHADTHATLIITEMLEVIRQAPEAQMAIRQIDPDFLYTYQADIVPPWIAAEPLAVDQMSNRFIDSVTVLDAWGLPIYATHPGRPWLESDGAYGSPTIQNEDGTIQTYNEETYGIARNGRVCFVSAGPDLSFGHMFADPGSPAFAPTEDNLFSYEVDRPAGY